MTKKKALIVGSGIAGIASAIRLAVKGYAVEVFEANAYPGGKLTVLENGPYRFDAGPSLFTMPQYVEDLFLLAGKNPADYFTYERRDVACHYFFEDGTFLPFSTRHDELFEQVEKTLGVSAVPLKKHLETSAMMYEKTKGVFLEKSLHKIKNYLTKTTLKGVAAIPRLHLFESMHEFNRKALNHEKLVQIFDRFATYNGSNPYQAPGILNIIPHLEHGIGTYFPTNGMHSITTSLVRLAEELGVYFHYNTKVTAITLKSGKAQGIETEKGSFTADVVVNNMDVKKAYEQLLKKNGKPFRKIKQEPSSSALIFYWGINRSFPQLELHNILFSADYKREFDCIFKQKNVFDDPTVYIHISSKAKTDDAPQGGENWFIMVNVPANNGQDWEEIRSRTRKNIVAKINRMLACNIETHIATEDYLDPLRIEARTSSHAGALYGTSSNERMAAFFRHPNFSSIRNLYFVGGSVHPGGGIPLCLLSAKIACEDIH